MLSYRHAYHAGNHADVLKHFMLYLALDYFNQKDKPYWYIDTHSGAGVYNLHSDEAQKVSEYQQGIQRLREAQTLPEKLAEFLAHLNHELPDNLYWGSPWLAKTLLRDSDKMRLFELHPTDFRLLLDNMREANLGRRGIVKQEDGFAGLISLLPPATRRAVVLIDPPYEQKQDYAQVVQTMKDALKRFEQGCYMIWYPCLSREESRTLPEKLVKLMPDNYLHAQLFAHAPRADGFGMHGSGMFVFNPPYKLAQQLQETLPEIAKLLAQDSGAKFVLDCQIK
ncbi:23S rRNA (adenine(2030)-N(6))-methyltransferase RlmJ [Kingella negevensis]|uniref:Ribosomal RNA large subunit methyltransferase J n=1 Tax=Kingella negevensis TaxID=1522312 RepID=A0A238TD40_9NEIS|nr:23S rRNA (adenine(2030)-N(6))-methyltransferase RlmJ [Kingella negevensis]MDK4679725.1 23S rRNA (adenine(2030)-N(6))-methyltransferase RlmJ [Kingella negevensis]MDK4682557.1 23S rRNA (adenine(2030)-N(6))-methyltransferase RlmJ [Kingella negevensis]MDK4684428.1 23S rRNA (adenine(2030)-N(6))-methyltransferase RlmJ [Kingella negevensis]MDK4688760.1 23S rRNA (adenine(2030)-N(6))-methyltransferase RlmJ [Kingella negevensis]MDK4690753.1 23S rRNA (adenine(2030)-N(6))-methyltransferase RlmJ [Kingel